MKKNGFTLVELIVSVALLIGAISIALFATIGSGGLIQRTDARAAVTESGRAVSDTFRRVVANASMSSVSLTNDAGTNQDVNSLVWVKSFSREQSASVCQVIGRASLLPDSESRFVPNEQGTMVAFWIVRFDTNQECVGYSNPANLANVALYQNRLTAKATYVVDFKASLTYVDPARRVFPLLRYILDIGLTNRRGELIEDSRTTPIVLASAVPVGLINPAISPLVIDTSRLPDASCGSSYSAQLQATGGQPNYTWQSLGNLPSGLTLTSNGLITGLHNCSTTSNFELPFRVTDSLNASISRTVSLRVVNAQGELNITSTSPLPPTNSGATSYSWTFTAEGAPAFSWSLIGGVPPTAMIHPSTGVFTFNPFNNPNTYSFQVRVVDATNPARTFTKDFSITVSPVGGGGDILLP